MVHLCQRLDARFVPISTEGRGHQDDAGVLCIRRDGFVREPDEIDDIRGYDRAPFTRRVLELGAVVQLVLPASRALAASMPRRRRSFTFTE